MNDNGVVHRVYSGPDGRGVSTCTWTRCDNPSYSWFPICFEHAALIAEAFTDTLQDAATIKRRVTERHEAARTASRGDQPGWIYYIRTDGKIKIGYSTQVTQRLRAYPPGAEILAVHPGTPDLEKRIHQDFDAYRVAGREWFSPADEILNHCATIREQHGNPKRYAPKVRAPHEGNRIVAGKRHH